MSPRTNTKLAKPGQLRRLRESLGLTRDQVASGAGYSSRQVARWETGQGRVREAVMQYLLGLQPHGPAPGACDFTLVDLFACLLGFRTGFTAGWRPQLFSL